MCYFWFLCNYLEISHNDIWTYMCMFLIGWPLHRDDFIAIIIHSIPMFIFKCSFPYYNKVTNTRPKSETMFLSYPWCPCPHAYVTRGPLYSTLLLCPADFLFWYTSSFISFSILQHPATSQPHVNSLIFNCSKLILRPDNNVQRCLWYTVVPHMTVHLGNLTRLDYLIKI